MGTMLAINGNIINSQEPLPIPQYSTYEKMAEGTTLDQLKTILKGMSTEEYLNTMLRVVASDNNGGVYTLHPFDMRSNARQYEYAKSPYNATYATICWTVVCNVANDTIKYYQNNQPINAAMVQSEPTVSAWELYRMRSNAQDGESYPRVVATAAANQTYAAQLAILDTALSGLTESQKARTVIRQGTAIYNVDNTAGSYTRVRVSTNDCTAISLNTLAHKCYAATMGASATGLADQSALTDTAALELIIV